MLSFELRLDKQFGGGYSSANAATCDRGSPWTRGGSTQSGRGRGHDHSGADTVLLQARVSASTTRTLVAPLVLHQMQASHVPRCQVCMKVGHTVVTCWYRFDVDFVPDNHMVTMVSPSSNDPNWYLDSCAIDHITCELEKLTMHQKYKDNDQIWVANVACIDIIHVSKTVLPTSSCPLHLKNVLHVSHTHKYLVSIHQFNIDNNTFITLHPLFFLDQGSCHEEGVVPWGV
jgi:hypothetical protein